MTACVFPTSNKRMANPGNHSNLARDLGKAARLGMTAVIARLTPERTWPFLCRQFANLIGLVIRPQLTNAVRQMNNLFANEGLPRDPRRIALNGLGHRIHSEILYSALHRSRGWHPKIAVSGKENIDAALQKGRGAILWGSISVYGNLMIKMG